MVQVDNPSGSIDRALLQIALDLSSGLGDQSQYQRLIEAISQVLPCDASALFLLQKDQLVPVAMNGLPDEIYGYRFKPVEHPRLQAIIESRDPVRFAANSSLPDPFDQLLSKDTERSLDVHDCMGCSLYVGDTLVGLLTLDALTVGAFDEIDDVTIATFAALAAATLRNGEMIRSLEQDSRQQQALTEELMLEARQQRGEMIGFSQPMQTLKQNIKLVAPSDLVVLLCGETGTGKELAAHAVHTASPRANSPLVHVNCAALPDNIAESELFGHVKGAFTGAHSHRAGKFELADGGTLFLDELGELSLPLQAKLLRAIQQGEIQRVGADKNKHVDVRIIAATNRNLAQMVQEGTFREDLYHRLNVFPITLPPLKERKEDIAVLAGYILDQERRRLGMHQLRLHPNTLMALEAYHWPGNVRELEHLLMRASLRAMQGSQLPGLIMPQHLDLLPSDRLQQQVNNTEHTKHLSELDSALGLPSGSSTHTSQALSSVSAVSQERNSSNAAILGLPQTNGLQVAEMAAAGLSVKEATQEFQRQLIQQALEQNQGIIAKAARQLQTDRGNFYRMAKKLGLI